MSVFISLKILVKFKTSTELLPMASVCQQICLILGKIVTLRPVMHYPWLASGLVWIGFGFGIGIEIGIGVRVGVGLPDHASIWGNVCAALIGGAEKRRKKGKPVRNSDCDHKSPANVSGAWQIFQTNSLKCSFDTVSSPDNPWIRP